MLYSCHVTNTVTISRKPYDLLSLTIRRKVASVVSDIIDRDPRDVDSALSAWSVFSGDTDENYGYLLFTPNENRVVKLVHDWLFNAVPSKAITLINHNHELAVTLIAR